ncbi:hypothetical protein [Psychrobacter pacificensis]|uniref:hypothetical protein n=1 Tax=Psychrobacter pacificensis TaxID=112002 RepID=UPI003B27B424
MVTCQATSEKYHDYDFISRYFWPANSRGGVLDCTVADDRVLISGNAVSYLTGFITVEE